MFNVSSVHFNTQFGTFPHWRSNTFKDSGFIPYLWQQFSILWGNSIVTDVAYIPCFSSVLIDNNPTNLNPVNHIQLDRHVLSIFLENWLVKWRLTLTRKWAEALSCMNHNRCLCCKGISSKRINYFREN